MSERSFFGQWWLSDAPEQAVGGILTIEPSGRCRLQLTGCLVPNRFLSRMDENAHAEDAERLILGSAAHEYFTLLGARDITADVPMTGDDYPQLLSARTAIRGVHLASGDEPCFNGVEVELDNLTAWSGLTGLMAEQKYEFDEDNHRVVDLRAKWELTRPGTQVPTAHLGDFQVELAWQSSYSAFFKNTNVRREIAASEEVHAKIRSKAPLPWDAFQKKIKVLQDLLTFATRHPCAVRSVQLLISKPEGGTAELLYAPLVEPQKDAKTEPAMYLFRMIDLPFDALLEKWGELHSRIGMGIHVLFGLDYDKNGFIENQILNATAAAESIHRALRPDATAILPAVFDSLVAKIKKDFEEHECKGWLLERISNDSGFVMRARELAAIPSAEAVEAVIGNAEQWAKWARDARNAVAHLEGKRFEKIPEQARWGLPGATIALLHLVLLAEIGIPAEAQLMAARMVYRPATEGFRDAVAKKCDV